MVNQSDFVQDKRIIVIATLYIVQEGDARDRFIPVFREFLAGVHSEPGMNHFTVSVNGDFTEYGIYEEYKDQAAFDAHANSVHSEKFNQICKDEVKPLFRPEKELARPAPTPKRSVSLLASRSRPASPTKIPSRPPSRSGTTAAPVTPKKPTRRLTVGQSSGIPVPRGVSPFKPPKPTASTSAVTNTLAAGQNLPRSASPSDSLLSDSGAIAALTRTRSRGSRPPSVISNDPDFSRDSIIDMDSPQKSTNVEQAASLTGDNQLPEGLTPGGQPSETVDPKTQSSSEPQANEAGVAVDQITEHNADVPNVEPSSGTKHEEIPGQLGNGEEEVTVEAHSTAQGVTNQAAADEGGRGDNEGREDNPEDEKKKDEKTQEDNADASPEQAENTQAPKLADDSVNDGKAPHDQPATEEAPKASFDLISDPAAIALPPTPPVVTQIHPVSHPVTPGTHTPLTDGQIVQPEGSTNSSSLQSIPKLSVSNADHSLDPATPAKPVAIPKAQALSPIPESPAVALPKKAVGSETGDSEEENTSTPEGGLRENVPDEGPHSGVPQAKAVTPDTDEKEETEETSDSRQPIDPEEESTAPSRPAAQNDHSPSTNGKVETDGSPELEVMKPGKGAPVDAVVSANGSPNAPKADENGPTTDSTGTPGPTISIPTAKLSKEGGDNGAPTDNDAQGDQTKPEEKKVTPGDLGLKDPPAFPPDLSKKLPGPDKDLAQRLNKPETDVGEINAVWSTWLTLYALLCSETLLTAPSAHRYDLQDRLLPDIVFYPFPKGSDPNKWTIVYYGSPGIDDLSTKPGSEGDNNSPSNSSSKDSGSGTLNASVKPPSKEKWDSLCRMVEYICKNQNQRPNLAILAIGCWVRFYFFDKEANLTLPVFFWLKFENPPIVNPLPGVCIPMSLPGQPDPEPASNTVISVNIGNDDHKPIFLIGIPMIFAIYRPLYSPTIPEPIKQILDKLIPKSPI
ncbi:3-ketoacyl-(acyl-carrier) reductase [Ceratobasidium sp. AG-Ba]|nr:3-ketoacyl-(acyl-carrier) reductase [Ceratobasidium sp. AG-Ba]